MADNERLLSANKLTILLAKRFRNKGMVHYDDLMAAIADVPTVDAVEVVHGRWIDRPSVKGEVYCSECATIEKSTDCNFKSRICPNCGAKMDGGNEDGNQTDFI